ncbi:MAG TPA: hypothetical protein VNO79_02675 [Actinomycetota bacterium]|nr:hypothetical protein [Actinomycetota bacterium]
MGGLSRAERRRVERELGRRRADRKRGRRPARRQGAVAEGPRFPALEAAGVVVARPRIFLPGEDAR